MFLSAMSHPSVTHGFLFMNLERQDMVGLASFPDGSTVSTNERHRIAPSPKPQLIEMIATHEPGKPDHATGRMLDPKGGTAFVFHQDTTTGVFKIQRPDTQQVLLQVDHKGNVTPGPGFTSNTSKQVFKDGSELSYGRRPSTIIAGKNGAPPTKQDGEVMIRLETLTCSP